MKHCLFQGRADSEHSLQDWDEQECGMCCSVQGQEVSLNSSHKVRDCCFLEVNLLRWDAKQSGDVAYRVEHEYFVHLIMDNLPCATR